VLEICDTDLAAETLLMAAAERCGVVQKTMDFIIGVLNTPNLKPRHKSGALQMMASLAKFLLRVNTWRIFDSLLTYENNPRFMGGAINLLFSISLFPLSALTIE